MVQAHTQLTPQVPLQVPLQLVLVEDNADLRDDLQFQLSSQGLQVAALPDALALDNHLLSNRCDVAVLDIGLPGESGLSIAARLRQAYPAMGIIMLTARGELDSRLDGYKQGADTYLVKPVDWRELLAQIHALHRRAGVLAPPALSDAWMLKQAGRELVTPQGRSISLTHMESVVLTVLAQHAGQTVDRDVLMSEILGEQAYQLDPRRLEVCISRLRQKMLDAMESDVGIQNDQLPLKTVRGAGYTFTQPISIQQTTLPA